jgi:hypothetical protein
LLRFFEGPADPADPLQQLAVQAAKSDFHGRSGGHFCFSFDIDPHHQAGTLLEEYHVDDILATLNQYIAAVSEGYPAFLKLLVSSDFSEIWETGDIWYEKHTNQLASVSEVELFVYLTEGGLDNLYRGMFYTTIAGSGHNNWDSMFASLRTCTQASSLQHEQALALVTHIRSLAHAIDLQSDLEADMTGWLEDTKSQ